MKIIDNISHLLGDDLKTAIVPKTRLKIAASCFSIYAYEALKSELSKIDSLEFIFTAPTFVPNEVTDKISKQRREFYIPKSSRESTLYGSDFEIHLRNKLTQRAIARECVNWIRKKVSFKSNNSKSQMQQFICADMNDKSVSYTSISGFTAVDLGYQKGDAVSNFVNRFDEPGHQKLMNRVIREGVKTKVLMLSATPVNNHFSDLRNQLALAYEGDSENLNKKLKTKRSVEEIFRRAQAAFNTWSKLQPEERTARAILDALDFDFFELLDCVTIARSRRHIETFYDTKDIGKFPERRKPLSFHCALTSRPDVMGFNEIFGQLSLLKMAVYAPVSYILPSRLRKYEELYDTQVEGGRGKRRHLIYD